MAAAAPPPLRGCLAAVDPPLLGLLLQLLSTLFISVMAVVAKVAGQAGLPVFEIVLARSLVLLALSTGTLARAGEPAAWPWRSPRRGLLLVRGLMGLGAVSSLYGAVQLLPLADTAVLAYLAPVITALAAPLALGERTGRGVALALPLSVAGVVLVAQPAFLFGGAVQSLSAAGVALGVAQAFFSSAAKLCIRALNSSEPVGGIIWSMAAVSSAGSAALCALLPRHFVLPRSAAAWGLLLAAGLLGCAVQLLSTAALKFSKAAPTVAMSYMSVVWGLMFDLLIFRDPPSALSLLGALLVGASMLLLMHFERRGAAGASGSSSGRDAAALAAGLGTKGSPAAVEVVAAARWQQRQRGLHADEEAGAPAAAEDLQDEHAPLIAAALRPARP